MENVICTFVFSNTVSPLLSRCKNLRFGVVTRAKTRPSSAVALFKSFRQGPGSVVRKVVSGLPSVSDFLKLSKHIQ